MKAKVQAIGTTLGMALLIEDEYERNLVKQMISDKIVSLAPQVTDVEIDITRIGPERRAMLCDACYSIQSHIKEKGNWFCEKCGRMST